MDKKTVELAKVYENQGYYREALEIYSFLNKEQTSDVVQEGLKRMEKKMEEDIPDSGFTQNISKEKKISMLFERWLNLMILKQRLINFKKIKSRLS
ncbi:MAG: hypothetical protein PF690_08555 [Deltaproteobacteria bacterium]|jgi:hypothetical protein|nr:hypothetical protein [Deltaproteobacteria bacterium]